MSANYFKLGSWNVICDICGKKRKRERVKKTWDGFLACLETCYDIKHPNEYPRKIFPDGLPVSDARPRPEAANWTYIHYPGITSWETSGLVWTSTTWRWDDDSSNGDITIGTVV